MLAFAFALFAAAPALASSVLVPSSPSVQFGSQDVHFQSGMQENYNSNSLSFTTVQSVTITGPDASSFRLQPGQDFCTGQTVPPLGACRLNVLFYGLPSGPGPKSATLELVDSTGTVDVPLSANAITGTATVGQNSLDLGAQVVNQGGSAQQQVTVATGLDAGVVVSNAQINGPDASSFSVQGGSCQGFSLGPNTTCQVSIQFQPTSAGVKHAQLEIDNDGTVSPLFVSLNGVGLNGPALTVSPSEAVFGNVTLGSSSSQTFTLANSGDAPLQFQGVFLSAGSPQVFPVSGDGCSGQQLAPGSSCHITIGFIPIAGGGKDAALFVISNVPGGPGVRTIGLSGTGVPANPVPSGRARVSGTAQAGNDLTCSPASFPPRTIFAYQWSRNGRPVAGATGRTVALTDRDVGAVFACRVRATAPGGSQTVTSPASAPTIPLDLSLLRDGLIDTAVCRTISTPAFLAGGVHGVFGSPVTPWTPFHLDARSRLGVSLDGLSLGSGNSVNVSPRTFARFGDGTHTLQVNFADHTDRGILRLAACRLAARLEDQRNGWSELTVSSRTGISTLTAVLSPRLKLALPRETLGQITYESAGLPDRSFYLQGRRTTSNGVTVSLSQSAIDISGVPIQVGVIKLQLRKRVLLGPGGDVTVHATIRGNPHRLTTTTPAQPHS